MSELAKRETSPLETIVADWSRFSTASLDSLPAAISAVRAVENLAAPEPMVTPLARVSRLIAAARDRLPCARGGLAVGCDGALGDLAISLETAEARAHAGLLAAAGVLVESTVSRELLAVGDTLPVTITVYNQGRSEITLDGVSAWTADGVGARVRDQAPSVIRADSAGRVMVPLVAGTANVPWWLAAGKHGDIFAVPGEGTMAAGYIAFGEDRVADTHARAMLRIAGVPVTVDAGPIVYRFADPARGEQRRPVTAVPGISVLFDADVEYARAGVPFERTYHVRLHNASVSARSVSVSLAVPRQLTVDSLVRRVAMEPFGDAVLAFRVTGALPAGRHRVSATAESGGETFNTGYVALRYDHIRPLRFYRAARVEVEAVEARLPARTTIAYIRGVGDNVATMLGQLGMKVTLVTPEELAGADLAKFGAIVVGPRAFAANPALVAQARRLQDFARGGGTVVVQYGQYEILTPGILPYPITLARPAGRVTDESASVTVLAPGASVLTSPNRITNSDFRDWVQERSIYMPTTADPRYQRVFAMHDPGEPLNENAVLIAPVGKGAFVYSTLALFRQLPSGVPGAARIFLNLIAADGKAPPSSLPRP